MRRLFFLLSFLVFSFASLAQLQDDFSDGNLSENPEWLGQTNDFTVTSGELQLDNGAAGSSNFSYLYLPAATSLEAATTWEFYFRMEFAPSSNNNVRIYLMADGTDLTSDFSGYYIQAGKNLSEDALELYRQDGSQSNTTLLLAGTAGAVANAPAEAAVRVTRTTDGTWELFADYSGGTNYQSEGTVQDAQYDLSPYFGLVCKYTSSNNDNFFFDNFLIDPLYVDQTPPLLQSAAAVAANEIAVQFNEPLDPSSANNASNYSIDNGIGTPQSAQLDGGNPSLVLLTLSNTLTNGQSYQLSTSNIEDVNGNASGNQSTGFDYIEFAAPELFDVLINEIMADPSPSNGLPELEFIELYNRTDKNFQLENWEFGDGTGTSALPSFTLAAQEYVIVCAPDDVPALSIFGTAIGLSGFPGLNNTGDDLVLLDAEGTTIDAVSYSDEWYRDSGKAAGGFTLERINPFALCGESENWIASESTLGGTPGQENSVLDAEPDVTGPTLLSASPLDDQTLLLEFSELLDAQLASDPGLYSIDQGLDISGVSVVGTTVFLDLSDPMEIGQLYMITLSGNLADCLQNIVGAEQTAPFINSKPGLSGEVQINELMIDPSPSVLLPEVEYVELINVSEEVFDLKGWYLVADEDAAALPSFLLFPDSLVLISANADADMLRPFGSVIGLSDFQGLVNSGDEVFLLNRDFERMDYVPYTSEWYRDTDKDDGGWSLEKINLLNPCSGSTNWIASESPLGGSPGQENSVANPQVDESGPELFRVFPEAGLLLKVIFTKALDPLTAEDLGLYQISPDVQLFSATQDLFSPNVVFLELGAPLTAGTTYTLTINAGLEDCIGNPTTEVLSIDFGVPEQINTGDLVISEVLFNPNTGGRDFLELYNASDKFFNANDLAIGNISADADSIVGINRDFLIYPGSYFVITNSPLDLQARYTVPFPENVLGESLPPFGDKEGNVTVLTTNAPDVLVLTIDAFNYAESLHNPLLDDKNGVSIERVDLFGPSNADANWHSAASTVGFATPTGPNSQEQIVAPGADDGPFVLVNATFSPDGDGFEDFLLIEYTISEPGFLANIKIFDGQGRLVNNLADNWDLANNGSVKWDGDTLDGVKARIGIYIVWIELFHPDGQVERYRLPCVVAAQLD